MKTLDKINQFVNKYLTLFVLLIVAIVLIAPGTLTPLGEAGLGTLKLGTHSFRFSSVSIMLMIIMYNSGTSVGLSQFLEVLKKPFQLILAVIAKFFLMALTAFLIARLFRLNANLSFGMILLGTMPPGTAAAVLASLAGGEVPFSLAMCVLCTLSAPLASPLLTMRFGGTWIEVDFINMLLNIVIVVLIPMILGILTKAVFQEKLTNFKRVLTTISLAALIIMIGCGTAPNTDVILSLDSVIVIIALIVHFLFASACFFLLTRLLKMDLPRSHALIITSCEQNNALAVGIAATFANVSAAIAIPSIICVALNFILATILTNLLGRRAEAMQKKQP